MTILLMAIYLFCAIPIKLPVAFFTELKQIIQKICMEIDKTLNSQNNLEKEKYSWRNHADFELYYKGKAIKTVWYWHKNRYIDQWNRIESPEINPCTYGQLIYNKGDKNIQWRKDSLFNKWWWENYTPTCKTMKWEHSFTPYTEINSTCFKDLHIRWEIIKFLEVNIDGTLLNCSSIFLDKYHKVKEINAKIYKWNLIKFKSFLHSKWNYQPN